MPDEEGVGHPFVGRVEVVEALLRRLEEVRGGVGRVSLIVGEAGVGKSTLVSMLVREIRERPTHLLIGRASGIEDPPPFSLLRSAIESARDDPLFRADAEPRIGGDPALIGFVPALREAEYPAPTGLEQRLLEVLGSSEPRRSTKRDQLLSGVVDRLLELTRHGPTVLILEDLHRGDRPSIAAVQLLAKELAGRPLWILATVVPTGSLAFGGRARMEEFERTTGAERIALRPMTSEETAEFLRASDPTAPLSAEEIARRYSETGGNLYLLRQLGHREPEEEERPAPSVGGGRPSDEADRRTLELAAVLGSEFPFALLLKASQEDEEHLAETVNALVDRGLLFERPGEILKFPREREREEAYQAIPDARLRDLHLRAAEALEAGGSDDPSGVFALARHFHAAHEPARSVRYNRIAARLADRALAPETAWEYLVHALESQRETDPGDPEIEEEIVLELARVLEELGLLRDAEAVLREHLDRRKDDPRLTAQRRAALEILLCRVLTSEGNNPEASELARKVLGTPDLSDQLAVRIGAHHQLGMTLYYEGRYDEALAHHTEEIAVARKLGNPMVLARAQIWRVANLAMLGQTAQAIAEAREVTEARDRFGSVRESAQAHLFLGDILADARSPPSDRHDALQEYARTIQYAEQAKDPRRVGWALYKTSELLREAGRGDEADQKVRLACHIMERVGDRVGLSVTIKVRGQLAMDRGDLDGAAADLLEARRLLEGTDHALEEIEVILRQAQLCSVRGDLDGAYYHLSELESRNLPQARPDLAVEFDTLQRSCRPDRTTGADPMSPRGAGAGPDRPSG